MSNVNIKKWTIFSCCIGLLLSLGVACDGNNGNNEPSGTEITLNTEYLAVDYFKTAELEAFSNVIDEQILWTSSNEKIAVVNDGVITPMGNTGRVTITASVKGVSASCVVDVVQSSEAPVLYIPQDDVVLNLGDEFTFTPNVYYEGEIIAEPFTYQLSLAKNAQEGVVQANLLDGQASFSTLSKGETLYEISTVFRNFALVKTINVKVVDEDLTFVSKTLEKVQGGFALNLGLTETLDYATSGQVELSAYKNGEEQADFNPTWTVNQTGDIFSFEDGIVTPLKEGVGTLTTQYQDKTITVHINVVRPLITQAETLTMETVCSQLRLPITLTGDIQSAKLIKKSNNQEIVLATTYENDVLTYDASVLPKRAEDLGEYAFMIETDKARYGFPVNVYTMVINTEQELNELIPTAKEMGNDTYWTGYFVLGNDIRCTGTYVSQWDGNRVGEDALADSTGFNGIFDGCGYTIYNLKTTGISGGLIPCLNYGGEIKNVSLVNASNTGKGGVVCSLCCGKVENVYVSVSVKGEKGSRNRNYTSAFISDVVSTARISKIFVEILEKTGDTQYCNPFYVMHEGYGIVNSFYAVGTNVLWEKSQWEGTQGEAKDCGAYADVVAMKRARISTKHWENEFWSAYNGLPYPSRLDVPETVLKITLSAKRVTSGEKVEIIEISNNTLFAISNDSAVLGVTVDGNTINVPENLPLGTVIKFYAKNVYNPMEYIEVELIVVGENDLKDGEFDDEDIWE